MVPIILDKSTFQSLSSHEHIVLSRHFILNVIPILPIEVLGDLAKDYRGKALPEDKVKILSDKFIGSGTPQSAEYRYLCMNSLLGNQVPLTGQIIAAQSTIVPEDDGKYGVLIENTALNYAILRWSQGDFTEIEHMLAKARRDTLSGADLEAYKSQIDEWNIVLPRVSDPKEIPSVLDEFCSNTKLQGIWMQLLLRHLNPKNKYWAVAWRKWKSSGQLVWRYAPYAGHCLRVILAMQIATRSELIRYEPNNISDAQYLHYLPFCGGFFSNDKLHLKLAPLLAREDQVVMDGVLLKADIKRMDEKWKSFSKEEVNQLRFALGSHPLPIPDSPINNIWDKVCHPWTRSSGNRAIHLSEFEKQSAWALAEKLYSERESS